MDPENELGKIQPILMPALRTGEGFVFSLSLTLNVCIDLWLTFFKLGEETDFISPEAGDKWTMCVVITDATEETGHRKQDKHTEANCLSS